MGRKTEIKQLPADMPEILPLRELSIVAAQGELASLQGQHERAAQELATQLGYEGALTVDALEDEIRFYGRRTVEVLLEIGKRLLILKEMTPHGEFAQRVEVLGIGYRTAASFMSAVKRSNKSATVAVLADRVKNAKAFMELITHDDDIIENMVEMDDFDRMSASELRAKAREMQAEKISVDHRLGNLNTRNQKLEDSLFRIQKESTDERLLGLRKEATAIMNDALGAVRGGMRKALVALRDHPGEEPSSLFMAGLVGQVQYDLTALREEFGLPDVSTAADAQLIAEMAQWAKD